MDSGIVTKKCSRCKKLLPITEFYKNRSKPNGLCSECKVCCRDNSREWQRKKLHTDPAFKQYRRDRYNKWRITEHGKEVHRAAAVRYKSKHSKQVKAQSAIQVAVLNGTVTKPSMCSRCGNTGRKIHGHHPDYNKPLEVIWVCQPCHIAIHKSLNLEGDQHGPKNLGSN